MTKTKRKKQAKRPADLTTRNSRSYNKRLNEQKAYLMRFFDELVMVRTFARTLIDLLKSKRLLTPSQVKMLEDALR